MPDGTTILYIEDNPDNQRLVQRLLEARNFQVLIAPDGPQGIALARETTPDLILVDINIPGLDGFETTTRLRSMAHLRNAPIVALTADSQEGTRERSLAAGCDGFLTKPIDPRRLHEQLQEFISGKREELPQTVETTVLREYTQKLVERLERQVREAMVANAELQELDRLKSQFLALLSHELRTPLTSILGFVELFERGTLGPLTQSQKEAITVIGRNVQTLVRHLNSLLYLQEVRSSQLRRVPMMPHEMLQRLMSEMRARAQTSGIEVEDSIAPTRTYNGDMVALEYAFRHLLDNAIKFTPGGGRVSVAMEDEASRIILRVQDTGIGIPPSLHEKIFLPFYQVDSSLARNYTGVGIGLAIVKHVIEAHGGQVTVRSTPGSGSTFTVVLPRA
ncbi:MAG TPA: hybrid sensor histidine kinase/response regulator [Roseiflexaceae bacterium]|nr:hybrid sensor histidine kinase/response regulator [Roseiflexaceae bacterium]